MIFFLLLHILNFNPNDLIIPAYHNFLSYFPGIFAYLNYLVPTERKKILEILIQGLKRLEYRGYDSAGKKQRILTRMHAQSHLGKVSSCTFFEAFENNFRLINILTEYLKKNCWLVCD